MLNKSHVNGHLIWETLLEFLGKYAYVEVLEESQNTVMPNFWIYENTKKLQGRGEC